MVKTILPSVVLLAFVSACSQSTPPPGSSSTSSAVALNWESSCASNKVEGMTLPEFSKKQTLKVDGKTLTFERFEYSKNDCPDGTEAKHTQVFEIVEGSFAKGKMKLKVKQTAHRMLVNNDSTIETYNDLSLCSRTWALGDEIELSSSCKIGYESGFASLPMNDVTIDLEMEITGNKLSVSDPKLSHAEFKKVAKDDDYEDLTSFYPNGVPMIRNFIPMSLSSK